MPRRTPWSTSAEFLFLKEKEPKELYAKLRFASRFSGPWEQALSLPWFLRGCKEGGPAARPFLIYANGTAGPLPPRRFDFPFGPMCRFFVEDSEFSFFTTNFVQTML